MAYQPKSYKKFVATAATATLVASAIVPVASANDASTAAFTDVNDRYKAAVDYLVENNIAQGVTETQFGVQQNITRGDAAIMLAKALEIVEDENAAQSGFTDVPPRGALLVNALKAAGIVSGKTSTNFGWSDPLTRGEVALLMANVKAYDLSGDASSLKFTDVGSRYTEAVAGLVEAGITSGKTTTKFGTGDAITRGEFAIFIYKAETLTQLAVSNVKAAVDGNDVAVTAEVKNADADAKATVSVYPNGDVNAAPVVKTVDVVNGTVTTSFADLPVGTHTVEVKVGEVSSSTSFTIAAPVLPVIQSVHASATNDQIILIFSSPLNSATAEQELNYMYDFDKLDNSNTPVFPSTATVNSAFVGPYAPGQIVTLSFSSDALKTTDSGLLTISNLKDASNRNLETIKQDIYALDSADSTKPTVSSTLSQGTQTGADNLTANSGSQVGLTVTSSDNSSAIVSVRYRIQKPDNTFTSWTPLNAEDGSFDETYEIAKGTIDTTGFTGGTYKIITETVDAAGNVGLSTEISDVTNLTITRVDVDAPVINSVSGAYNATASGSKPANSVSVVGNTGDYNLESNISKVEYRVQSYNSVTNTYTDVTAWSAANPSDGSFNESNEDFAFTTAALDYSTTYRLQVRSTDAKGNVSDTSTVSTISGLTVTNGRFTTPAAGSADSVVPVITSLSSPDAFTNDPAIFLTGTVTDNVRVSSVEYAVYRDGDNNGSFETEVQGFTTSGVTPTDGTFNSTSEGFNLSYTTPSVDGTYRIVVRAKDSSGNTSVSSTKDYVLDTAKPTIATVVADATTAADDYLVTYTEVVRSGLASDDGVASESALDPDNYTAQFNNQVVTSNPATSVTAEGVSGKVFRVVFTSTISDTQTLNVTSVKDRAGNTMNPFTFDIN